VRLAHLADFKSPSAVERSSQAVLLSALLISGIFLLDVILNPMKWPLLIPMATCLIFTSLAFWLFRRIKGTQAKLWILFLEALIISAIVAVNHEIYLEHHWLLLHPYIGLKISIIVMALAAPPLALQTVEVFVLFLLTPIVQMYLFWDSSQRAVIGPEEPWTSIAFDCCAASIWYYRLRNLELSRVEAVHFAQINLFRRFVHLLLGAQHLTNTPLQTIATNARLIGLEYPQTEARVKAIERAFQTVHRVGLLIAFGDQKIRWDGDRIPDNLDELIKLVHQISEDMNWQVGPAG
jgi:hypothetical protein